MVCLLTTFLCFLLDFFGNETNARNLQADALSSSEIEAIWEVSPNNCDVFGYRVHYYEIDNPDNTGKRSNDHCLIHIYVSSVLYQRYIEIH